MGAQNFERKTRNLDGVRSLTAFGPNSPIRRRASALVKPGGIVAVTAVFETSIVVACSMPFTNWLLRQNTTDLSATIIAAASSSIVLRRALHETRIVQASPIHAGTGQKHLAVASK